MNDIPFAYETFAKLNIMSPMASNYSASQPQLMFSLADDNVNKAWEGQRIAFNYTNGGAQSAPLFRIHEKSNTKASNLNFDLLGNNNIYQGVVGAYSDSFIYSQDNEIGQHVHDCSFLNSDWNVIGSFAQNINFTDANYNTIYCGQEGGTGGHKTTVRNVQFYGSDWNVVNPYFVEIPAGTVGVKGIKGIKGSNPAMRYIGGEIAGIFAMNSDQNFFTGYTKGLRGTYISSPRNKHEFDAAIDYEVQIGNDLGRTSFNSGGLIAIGRGLTYIKGQGDKIILGNFNENDIDDNNVLIVGDGWINDDYLTSISPYLKTASGDNRFWSSFSGRGDKVSYYRHNLMKVNRKGWVGIYDYNDPDDKYAMYGVKGITAHFNGNEYRIPYDELYQKLNVFDTVSQYQETIDRYSEQVSQLTKTVPTTKNLIIDGNVDDLLGAYVAKYGKPEHNTIVNVTLQSNGGANTTKRVKSKIAWGNGNASHSRVETFTLHPYNSLQYIYLNDKDNSVTGFSKINN